MVTEINDPSTSVYVPENVGNQVSCPNILLGNILGTLLPLIKFV